MASGPDELDVNLERLRRAVLAPGATHRLSETAPGLTDRRPSFFERLILWRNR
jgi:hypothetical protein